VTSEQHRPVANATVGRAADLYIEPAPRFALGTLSTALCEHWALDAPLKRLDSERDLNIMVGDTHVLKVSHPAEPADIVAMEIDAPGPRPRRRSRSARPRVVAPTITLTDEPGRDCLARVIQS
jgi:hypothetical protein